jgi:hypothetical protein
MIDARTRRWTPAGSMLKNEWAAIPTFQFEFETVAYASEFARKGLGQLGERSNVELRQEQGMPVDQRLNIRQRQEMIRSVKWFGQSAAKQGR